MMTAGMVMSIWAGTRGSRQRASAGATPNEYIPLPLQPVSQPLPAAARGATQEEDQPWMWTAIKAILMTLVMLSAEVALSCANVFAKRGTGSSLTLPSC